MHCLSPDAFIMPKIVEKRKRVVLTLKQKVDICRRLERGESRQLMMEYGGISVYLIFVTHQLIYKRKVLKGMLVQ